MERRLQQFDTETGEVLEAGTLVYFPHRPKIKEGWMMTFQEGFVRLAQDRSLTQQQWRVFAYLIGRLDFENFIHLSQAEIARGLAMKPSNVSTAVAALVDKRILVRGPRIGRVATLRLTPNLGWKGRVRSLNAERDRQHRAHLELVTSKSRPEGAAFDPELSRAALDPAVIAALPVGPVGPKRRR